MSTRPGGLPRVQALEKTPEDNGVAVHRTIGKATFSSSTNYSQNLVIHVIATALTPGDLKVELFTSLVSCAPGEFSQFSGALKRVGQLDTLNDATSTMVFAPIDEAFAATNTNVANLTNEQLTSVLNNHVPQKNLLYSAELDSTSNGSATLGAQRTPAIHDGAGSVGYNTPVFASPATP